MTEAKPLPAGATAVLRCFAEMALARMSVLGSPPTRSSPTWHYRWRRSGGSHFWREPIVTTAAPLSAGRLDGPLRATAEYRAVRETFLADPWLGRHVDELVGSRRSRSGFDLDQMLDELLDALVAAAPDHDFDSTAFETSIAALGKTLMATEVEMVRGVVLSGLALPEPLDLGDGTEIRQLTEDEMGFLIDSGIAPGRPQTGGWSVTETDQYFICERIVEAKEFGVICAPPPPARDLEDCADRFRTAVRLVVGGTIDRGSTFSIHDTSSYRGGGEVGERRLVGVSARPAVIGPASTQEVVSLYGELGMPAVVKAVGLELPLRRFRDARLRPDASDVLVDLMIAAEGLLAPDEQRGLARALARESAEYCELTDVPASKVGAFIKSAYGARSSIVHGASPSPLVGLDGQPASLGRVVDDVERVVQAGLLRAVSEVA